MAGETEPAVTSGNKLAEMVDGFFATLGEIKGIEERLDALKASRDRQQLAIIDTLEAQGMTQVKDTYGRTVFLKEPVLYASINKENEKAAIAFLKKSWKLGYMFKEQLSSSSLGKVVRERLSKGLIVPEEYVTYFAKKVIGYRTGKTGADAE